MLPRRDAEPWPAAARAPCDRHLGAGLNVLCSRVLFCESGQVFSLKGRRALVTGGGSGIGKAMAAALAEAGAQVVLAGRSEQRLLEAAEATGASAWIATDLSAEPGCTAVCDKAPDIDILVNAAALNLRPPLEELRLEDWDRTIATNLTAPFVLGQRLGPEMAQRGWGRIINIGSQQSWRAFGNSGAYGASKAGMLGLTRSQAEAWSPSGVTANCIIPGFVRTPMTESVFSKDPLLAQQLAARTMVWRNGTVADFRGIAVFLASEAASFITGQAIAVDGGFSAT